VSKLYQFHVNIFACDDSASFAFTWEDAAAMLERLPRMIFELDGSFVVSGDDEAGQRWQVDGHLFDFDGRLHRMELRGQCPAANFDDLLRCVCWPAQTLAFEMIREGVRVDEQQFRQHVGVGH
jgi:carotenoid cleavage dioxygenase-like enzyme